MGWLRLVLNWPDYDVFGKELGANITTKNNDDEFPFGPMMYRTLSVTRLAVIVIEQ